MPSDKKYSIWPALIIIVLAFGVPATIGTLEIRIAHNAHAETAAVLHLRAIARSENDYRKTNNGFSLKLEDLKDLPKPDDFYMIRYRQATPDSYIVMAWPKQPGKNGKRYFFMDQTGVVRYEVMQPAGPASEEVPPIEKE